MYYNNIQSAKPFLKNAERFAMFTFDKKKQKQKTEWQEILILDWGVYVFVDLQHLISFFLEY